MTAKRANSAPIIKRITVTGGGGHHGGAWKVAYADFVTAMMAFFLLMWLLNATTEKQRKGLADYFNPTVVQSPNGGGDSTFGGKDQTRAETADEGGGTSRDASRALVRNDKFEEAAREIQNQLNGSGAESMQLTNLLRHVVTRMTDEGLVIELTDLTEKPLFIDETAQPTPTLRDLAPILSRVLGRVRNDISISGHVRAYPDLYLHSPVWALSDARAHTLRNLLEDRGFQSSRVQRVTAYADRRNRSFNPMDPTNNRIEVILLR